MRINHTCLLRASSFLHDPNRSISVGRRIFPFHAGPFIIPELVSKMDQLVTLSDQLLVSSHYAGLGNHNVTVNTNTRGQSIMKEFFKDRSYYESEEWRRKYGQWFSAYDVQTYLETNFDMRENMEYIHIEYKQNTPDSPAVFPFDSDTSSFAVSIKKSDLINSKFIPYYTENIANINDHLEITEKAICLEDVPSFRFTDVQSVLAKLIKQPTRADINVEEIQ